MAVGGVLRSPGRKGWAYPLRVPTVPLGYGGDGWPYLPRQSGSCSACSRKQLGMALTTRRCWPRSVRARESLLSANRRWRDGRCLGGGVGAQHVDPRAAYPICGVRLGEAGIAEAVTSSPATRSPSRTGNATCRAWARPRQPTPYPQERPSARGGTAATGGWRRDRPVREGPGIYLVARHVEDVIGVRSSRSERPGGRR